MKDLYNGLLTTKTQLTFSRENNVPDAHGHKERNLAVCDLV